MNAWTPCPSHCLASFDTDSLQKHWARLHRGDAQPWPTDDTLLEGWRLFHEGAFEAAAQVGRSLGWVGLALTNKATIVHATYVEAKDTARFKRLQEAAELAQNYQLIAPEDAAPWYWQASALAQYAQGISVAKALARGLGMQVRQSLELALRLAPGHLDALLALARFHAETIDQVGELIGGMVHGARKDQGLALYEAALAMAPDSMVVLSEMATGLCMLEGHAAQPRANALLKRALRQQPLDAMEKLHLRTMQASSDL